MELLQQPQEAAAAPGPVAANREPRAASATGELVLLQRQHSLLQEELLRLRAAENRFKDSEKARAKLERQVRHMRACCGDKRLQVSTPASMAADELGSTGFDPGAAGAAQSPGSRSRRLFLIERLKCHLFRRLPSSQTPPRRTAIWKWT